MAVWQRTFFIDVSKRPVATADVFPSLDKYLRRDWGTDGGQCWGDPDTNDIFISWNVETQELDDDIRVRVDLRKLNMDFITWVIEFATERGLKFKSRDTVFEPELHEVAKILANSNAERFVTDPDKFLDDFEKGLIKPEGC